MKYVSTRDVSQEEVSFEEALFKSYADDGGLYVPKSIPSLTQETLNIWTKEQLPYPKIVENIVRLYVSKDELNDEELATAITKAYSNFKIPISQVQLENGSKLGIVELFHGRTKAFKDLSLSLVAQLMQIFLAKRKRSAIVLVGTSGDTGPAAIQAIKGLPNVSIIVLYPRNMVSIVQEDQMLSAQESNVHIFQVEGTSDDLDVPIASCFPNPMLTCVNSINWGRVMIQIAHYVYVYTRRDMNLDEAEDCINVVVPTGAAGNITGGAYAKLMGVPIKLYATVNENTCIYELRKHGILILGRHTINTPASAMDIAKPYNVERLLWLASSSSISDVNEIKSCMTSNTPYKVSARIVENLRQLVDGSGFTTTEEIYRTMKLAYEKYFLKICPHTAVAWKYVDDSIAANTQPWYILGTASLEKFPEIEKMLGLSAPEDEARKSTELLREPLLMKKGDDWGSILKNQIMKILNETGNA